MSLILLSNNKIIYFYILYFIYFIQCILTVGLAIQPFLLDGSVMICDWQTGRMRNVPHCLLDWQWDGNGLVPPPPDWDLWHVLVSPALPLCSWRGLGLGLGFADTLAGREERHINDLTRAPSAVNYRVGWDPAGFCVLGPESFVPLPGQTTRDMDTDIQSREIK